MILIGQKVLIHFRNCASDVSVAAHIRWCLIYIYGHSLTCRLTRERLHVTREMAKIHRWKFDVIHKVVAVVLHCVQAILILVGRNALHADAVYLQPYFFRIRICCLICFGNLEGISFLSISSFWACISPVWFSWFQMRLDYSPVGFDWWWLLYLCPGFTFLTMHSWFFFGFFGTPM